MTTNPEIDQDRVFDLFDTYKKHGVVMFHQQKAIYRFIANRIRHLTLLEFGCGNGVGTAILDRYSYHGGCQVTATDKLRSNIEFARDLYGWIDFEIHNLNNPWNGVIRDIVVCIEAFEHVANPQLAMKHLMEAAMKEVWLSTPNGMGKPRPPENPHHVCEYTPLEILEFVLAVNKNASVTIYECDTFRILGTAEITPKHSPLLYRITLP